MGKLHETELPGLGKKFQLNTDHGENVVIIVYNDGKREVYHYDEEEEEVISSIALTDEEAKQVGNILEGIYYQPDPLHKAEVRIKGMSMEWVKVPEHSPLHNQSIGSLQLRKQKRISVVAAIVGNKTVVNPGADFVVEAGHTLVVVGEPEPVEQFCEEVKAAMQ